MESVVLVVHLIIALGIIILVLIQPSESGGFMGNSSMSNTLAPRRSGDALSRMTTIFGGLFFVTSLVLAIIATNKTADRTSIMDTLSAETPVVEKPAVAPAEKTEEAPKAPISE